MGIWEAVQNDAMAMTIIVASLLLLVRHLLLLVRHLFLVASLLSESKSGKMQD